MSLFLLIIIYKLLIDVREVKTRFKLIKHIDTEKKRVGCWVTPGEIARAPILLPAWSRQLTTSLLPAIQGNKEDIFPAPYERGRSYNYGRLRYLSVGVVG
jgi:hypothetical protein